ncbi:DNA polymerase phi-domain-containing protein [Umbelopsis sp. PMI_123]|nr:DNA polymerase phi-domain-containing protein [Umbelopsis sp. PMI_123]
MSTTTSTTLPLYWDLASFDPQKRTTAAQTLISTLANFQADFEENGGKADSTEDTLDANCAPDVSYALKRLIRGLPSSREAARQGYSLALTELLGLLKDITTKQTLDLLHQYTERTGAMTGEEARDMMFGRIFGLRSIISSGILSRSSTTLEDFEQIFDDLFQISQAKPYLSEVCYHVAASTLPVVSICKLDLKKEALEALSSKFMEDGINTPDQLQLVLAIQSAAPEYDLQKKFATWKNADVLSVANLPKLARILKETPSEDDEVKSSGSNWHPQLHSVWDVLLEQLVGEQASKSAKASFQEFWKVTVDESLFVANTSHERKYWGFQLVEKAMTHVPTEQIVFVFTDNFMRTFINNMSSEDRFLSKAARHTMQEIEQLCTKDSNIGFGLIAQLVGKYGNQKFDKAVRSKMIDSLLTNMDVAGIKSYITFLTKCFLAPEESNNDPVRAEGQRTWVAEQVVGLIRNTKVPKDEEWISLVLEFLFVHAFFDVVKNGSKVSKANTQPTPALSPATRTVCRDRFFAILGELSTMPPVAKVAELGGSVLKTRKLNGTMNNGEFWADHAVQRYRALEKDTKHYKNIVEFDEESSQAKKDAFKTIEKIKADIAKSGADQFNSQNRAFELLFLHLILQQLTDPQESNDVLGELQSCYQKVFHAPKSTKKSKAKEEDEDEPQPVEVLIDILLSFLSKSSALLRNLAEQVFEIFSDKLTKKALHLMLEELFEVRDDDMDTDDEEDDDVQVIDMEGSGNEDEESDNDDDDDENDDDDDIEDADDEEVDEELRNKIQEAMKSQGILAGSDDEDEDMDDLDDDQMEAFDEKLAEIFRQKKVEKNDHSKQHVVHFKNKVLELLSIFVRKNPTNPLIFEMILPLLNVVRTTSTSSSTKHFVDKTVALLNKRLSKNKEYPKQFDAERVVQILKGVHEFARTSAQKQMLEVCGSLSLYISKAMMGGEDGNIDTAVDQVLSIYSDSLTDYMTKKSSHMQPKFFIDFLNRFPQRSWPLFNKLLAYTDPKETVKSYRQSQAYQMMSVLIQRTVSLKTEECNHEFLRSIPAISDSLIRTFEYALDDKPEPAAKQVNIQRIKEVLKFAVTAIRLTKNIEKDTKKISKQWNSEKLGSLVQSIATSNKYSESPAVRSTCSQILTLLDTGIT